MSKEIIIDFQEAGFKPESKKGKKLSKLEAYELFNAATAVASVALIGGLVGFALATIDIAQIAAIEYYKRKRKK